MMILSVELLALITPPGVAFPGWFRAFTGEQRLPQAKSRLSVGSGGQLRVPQSDVVFCCPPRVC